MVRFSLPRWHSDRESACRYRTNRRCRFSPWVGKIPWRRKWQHTPAFLPRESHRQRSLTGYSPWVAKSRTWLSDEQQQQQHRPYEPDGEGGSEPCSPLQEKRGQRVTETPPKLVGIQQERELRCQDTRNISYTHTDTTQTGQYFVFSPWDYKGALN